VRQPARDDARPRARRLVDEERQQRARSYYASGKPAYCVSSST
jgi:hypothetical protein